MAINERLIDTEVAAAGNGGGGGTGNQEEGLILHLDANDVDSYDGDGTEWVDIKDHEYTPATNVDEHFNTVTYTGNGTSNSADCGFQPDLIWVKNRDATNNHIIVDSLRGATNYLIPNLTDTAGTTSSYIDSITSTGFTFDGTNGTVNKLNNNYVAWCFKAGGAAVSNTDGTITSQVSANNDLGFSIVSYTGAASGTVGHGLGVPPELIITKQTASNGVWATYSKALGTDKLLELNSSSGAQSVSNYWGTSAPTSTVYGLSTNSAHYNANGAQIAYCFASKRGVSKVGSYTGTGAAGNKVYTGFEPAFVMIKKASAAGNWIIIDSQRDGEALAADQSWAELDYSSHIEFNRDGFTLKSNTNNFNYSGTYIYYAVAKNTKETSLIPDTDLELHLDAASFPQFGESGYSNTPSTWTDSSGNGNNGTITSCEFDSELGNWLDFGGVNDKVTTSYDIPSAGAKTIEFWFNDNGSAGTESTFPSPIGGSNAAIWTGGNLTGSFSDESLGFFNADTGLHFYIRTGTNTYRDNNWHHVAITDNGSNQHAVYVDGESHSISYLSGSSTSRISINNVQIGKGKSTPTTGTYSYWFNGQVGQVRIYSSALTQDQIRQNYNFTKPSYPNGYDGTISGATWNAGGYFDFDGSNDKVTIASTATSPIDFTAKNYTIGCWINPDTSGVNQIFTKYGSSDSLRSISVLINTDNTLRLIQKTSTTDNSYSTSTIPQNTWTHIVVVRSSSDVKFYINGELDNTVSNTFTPNSGGNQPILIGTNGTTTPTYFNGQISDVKLYDKALSAAEVTAQFAIKQFDIG